MIQGIVIQGPTNYCREVAPIYENVPNVVWSTWEDEPQENIQYIQQYVPAVLNKKPNFPGYLNINMQTVSTVAGIEYLKERGVTEVLKTRGDLKITNLQNFLNILAGRSISFLAKAKENQRRDLYYELEYAHYSHDYPVDLIVYGETNVMESMFGFEIQNFNPIPPEALLAYTFMKAKGIAFSLNDKVFSQEVTYFLADCLENNIELKWLKHDSDIVLSHMNKDIYVY